MMADRSIAGVASWVLGLGWLVLALAKAPDPWHGATPGTWAAQWGTPTLTAVTIAELMIAWWFLTGRVVRACLWALALLAAFAVASYVRPPLPEQPCGCFGALWWADNIERLHPAVKAAGLASIHVLLLAWTAPLIPPSTPRRPASFAPRPGMLEQCRQVVEVDGPVRSGGAWRPRSRGRGSSGASAMAPAR